MAKKYWWEEDENTTQTQAEQQPQDQEKKTYWWEPESVAATIGNDVVSKVNGWMERNNSYFSNYQNRFSGRKGNYEDAYVSDSASWLESVKEQGKSLNQEAQSILSYVDQYKDYLDADWVENVKSAMNSTRMQYSQLLTGAKNDNKYWSKWETEDDYKKDAATAKDYEAKSTADIDALSKELEQFDLVADEFATVSNQYFAVTNNPSKFSQDQIDDITAKYFTLVNKYGTPEDFHAKRNEKKLFMADAKRIQEGITLSSVINNEDFDANSGYVSTKYGDGLSWDKAFNNQYGLGYEDLTYEYINGAENGMRSEILSGARKYSSDTKRDVTDKYTIYDQMTEDEISVYNYYYSKDGKEAAQKYLDNLQYTLNAREATGMFTALEDKTILELAFGVAAGLDQFKSGIEGLKNAITGNDEYTAPSSIQMASGMVREDLKDVDLKWYNIKEGAWGDAKIFGNSLGQTGYDAVTTTSNMLPSILTSVAVNAVAPGAGAVAGTALLGSSAGGNAYQEMINLGYDKGQARNYAVLVGASEAILQYALGGISSLSGGSKEGIFQSIAGKWLPHVDKAFARVAIKIGSNMLDEGLEEGIQEILNPWFKNLTLQTNEKVDWSEVAYSSLLGALTAGFMEGPTTIAGDGNLYKTGKKLQAKDISTQRLTELGKTFAADTEAYQLADKVNENTNAYTLGRLFNEIGATLTEQNISEITEALVAKGMNESVARKNAEALAYVVEGGQLSDKQIAIIEANDVLAEVARTTLIDANTTWNQRAKGYNEMLKALADEVASPKKAKVKQAQENTPATDIVDGQTEIATEDQAEAEPVDTSPAKVKNIADISKKTITLEDGSEVNVKDADLSPDDGVRIETIASIDGISTEDANFVLNTLRSNTGASAQMDSLGAKEVFKYGFYGFSQDHIAKHGVFANSLTESQRQAIYEVGQKARQKQIANASPKTTAKQRGIYFDQGGGKVVSFKDMNKGLLSEKKRSAGVQAAVILNKLGIGGDIYFFESYRNSEGKLVYKNSKGKEVKAPNGWFSESDGSIHIDLNAGVKGDGFVLFTLAHELTHFIEKWSPQKYKILADFLIENYEKGQSMDKLVRTKQAQLSANRGKPVSYNEAYSEVIADSMEAMLADGDVIEKIMELKAKDSDLVAKMKQFFDNLLAKIRNTYKGLTPDSAEGKAVFEMTDSIEKIQQLFAEALVEASDNFQTAQEQFSTDSIRGNADGAVAQSEVTTALTESTNGEILKSERTEYEALPKQVMSLSTGAGTLLNFIEGLVPTKLKGLSSKTTNGYTGRDVRAYAMGISGFSQEQIQRVNEFMDSMSKFMTEAGVTYKFIGLQDVKDAKLHYTYNADGSIKSIVLSAMVKNGDYPVNFDLSSICKKRVAMSKLIDKLAKRGSLDNGTVKLTPSNIFKINTTLKNEGYETACLGCFVESKRYNSLEWAKTFCNKWNAAVKKVNPNATYFGYGDNTFTDDSFTLEQAVKIDEAATKYITTTKVERLANALKKYKAREQAGLPLVEKLSDAAKKRLVKSETISDELKDKYLNADVTTLTIADVEFLLENEVLPGASLSNKQAVTEMVKSGEAYQHLLRPSDLLTDRGISKLEALPNFHGVLYGHYGSGTPKLMQSYTPYNSEIALLPANKNSEQTLEEYLYSIAGVRMQSFSDFQIQNIYDYLQMVADLAARKLPAHAYTKEISFAKLLGMTGIKTNLSVMFDIDPMVDKAHAGLTRLNKLVHRGEYAKVVLEDAQGKWVYNIGDYQTQKLFAAAYPEEAKRFLQSIGFGDAVKLQSTPGYSANCGIIGVGYSDLGIFAMLNDNRIRYIIPYHASSLPAEIKVATNIALGTDYTSYQNNMKIAGIVDKNGNAVNWSIKEAYKRLGSGQAVINELNEKVRTEGWVVTTKKAQTGHGTYGLYEDLQKTNDPRKTAGNFMDWCIGNGTLPLFYQFASHENYYKLLYDFNVYDCVTEEYAPQQAVTNTYPTMVDGQVQQGNVTDGGFNAEYLQGAIDKQMAFMDAYSKNLDEDLEEIADNLEEGTYLLHSDRFEEDKYFARQIDKIGELKDGSYVTVGKIKLGSPIEKVGIPAGNLYFDVSKIRQEMFDRGDPIPPETIKEIPKVLDNPMVITEYFDKSGKPSINVYGKLYIGSSPVVIGIMIGKHRNGQSVDKIQTVHPNRHFLDEVTDNNTLYLGENKKETNAWFQALGAQEPPLGGTKYGFIRMLSQSNKNVKISDQGSLTPDQQKHFDYNQKQKTVGSALKTLKGSPIKRSTKYGVGKEIGGEIYFHKDYAEDILPDEVLSQAMQLLEENHPGFEYNCLKYNPKTGVVAFQEAPDFDSAREPVVGDYVSVNTDTGVVKTGHSNYIWHHKWNWVKNDYSGFDVEESWKWSKQWLSTLTEVSDGNGIDRWNAQLDRFGLPKDGDSNLYSEREQEYDSKDTSVKILPATFTKFGLKATDRVLDWGGGQYDIAKKAVEFGYPGIKFEVVDAFNRTPTHNDRILAEYAENPATVLTINNVLNVIKETDIIEDVIRESKEYLAEDGVCYIKIYEGNDVDGKTGNGKVTSSGWQNNQPAVWYKPFVEKYYQYVEPVGDILVASDKPINKKELPKTDKAVAKAMRDKVAEIRKAEPSMRESLYSDRYDNSMSDRAKEILADAKPKMIGKNEKADIEFDTVRELFNELNADKDIQALADRVFKVAKEDHYGYYGYGSYGEPKSHIRLPIAFVGKDGIPNGAAGQFRKDTIWGNIVFSYDYFMDESVAPQRKASTILHEVIHAITCSHIENAYRWMHAKQGMFADPLSITDFDGVDERIKAGIELINAFEQVRSAPTKDGKNLYGQLTAYEMVAEMANVEFRNFLKKQNLWNRIVETIKRIFGIPKTTAYDAVSDALERILVETTNDADAQRAKTEARTANNRYSDRVLMGSLFSGGGTLEAGLVYQMLDKEFAVEYNRKIAATYTDNHGKEHMFVGDVQDFNSKGKKNVFYLHASPVCKNFSPASHGGGEKTLDIVTAQATARVLEEQMPQVFTVENVKRYIGSEAYKIITDKLTKLGYKWDVDVYKASDYGNATKRERMIIRAVKDGNLPAKPEKVSGITSWGEATRDLWDTDLIPSTLVKSKIEAIRNTPELKNLRLTKLDKPLMIYDTTKSKKITYAWADELAPTLTTKCGDARIIMPDGKVYEPTPKFMGRIQGLPDDYKYPKAKTNAFKIIGNGIPTQLTKAVMGGVLDSAYEQTHDGQVLYQDRADESVSNRSLLANAFEGLAQNDIEKNKIQEYKGKIDLINAEEKKLSELNAKIKELSFAKGPRDAKAIRGLQFEARQTANRINTYDKQLLRLEASKPLQDVLEREKKTAYQKAEQRGKDALNAYKERAAKTQRELLEKWQESRKKGIESREKTAMKHKIQRVVGELNQLLLNGDKTRHVPENLKKAVADALALVNMDTVGAEERAAKYAALIAKETDPDKIDAYTVTMENILRQGEKMGQRLKDLRDAYEEISESDDPDIANAYDPVIAGSLKELAQSIGNTSLRNMTIEQLQDVYDMYKMVLTRVRDANKSFLNDKKEAISSLASRVVGEVKKVGGEHKYRAAFLDFAKKFGWDNLKPVYAFEHLGSTTLTDAFNNVRAGEDVWAVDVTEAREYYLDKSKKYGYDSWDFKKKHRFESASEIEFELTLDQILSLYAYSKREQSLDHLRLGGFVFDSNIETYKEKGSKLIKYKVNTADAHQITPEILANITGLLTNEQKAFVDEMQDYLSAVMGAKGNEVTMQMYGVKLFKEKFYFPLKSAKQFMFEQNEVSGEVRIKNSGFTNKVVAKANNPVILSNFMDVWAGHVNDMSMYHAFVLPLEDFNRIFNYNSPKKEGQPPVSVKGTIQNAYSPAAVNYVRQLITDLNGGARSDSTTGIINKMIGLFKKGSVFASLSVVVQQPSAIARAVALVDTKYFIGPKVDHKRHKALWDEVKKYAPVAIIKEMGYFDTNMGKSTQDFITGKEYSGFKDKMKALVTDSNYRDEMLSKAPALADELAWCSIWEAVKRETKANNPGMDVKSEAFLKMAGERFTEVITKTQVYDSVLSRSGMMRSKDTGMKMATAFMAEPTTSINMIADALLQGKRGNRKYCRTAIGAVIASQIINSILVSFVYAGRDDDEDETYLEKYIGTLTGETLDSLNPAEYIPFIKDIVSIVKGYDVERSDMAVVSDLWKAWENLSKDNVSAYRKVEGFAGSIAQIFGLPVKNIMRDARGIYQTIMSFVNGEQTTGAGIGYAVKSALPELFGGGDVSKQQQLYEAYLSGDATQIDRVSGRFDDQKAINTAMRTAIKDHYEAGDIDKETAEQYLIKFGGLEDDDAYWKVEEWKYEAESGEDFKKYNDFYEAVQTGKNLKVVIQKYTDNGVEKKTLASQITQYFKPLYKEMSKTERAGIKGYLLNAYSLLGYDRNDKSKDIDNWLKD